MDIDERLFMSGNGNLFILETLHKYLESRPSYFYLLWQRSAKKVDKQASTVVVHEGLMGKCLASVLLSRIGLPLHYFAACVRGVFSELEAIPCSMEVEVEVERVSGIVWLRKTNPKRK